MIHQVAWYAALKRGVVDPSFANTQIQPVVYRRDRAPTATALGFEWNPKQFNWQYHRGALYYYYVVRAPVDAGAMLFRDATCRIALDAHAGNWWLYRREAGCQ
jgi:hypothetical protein